MAQNNSSKIMRKLNYLDDTKSLIRVAMENKGLEVSDDLRFREYADLINNLELKADETDATATANDIVSGKIAYVNNDKITGTLPDYRSVSLSAQVVNDNSEDEFLMGITPFTERVALGGTNGEIGMKVYYRDIDSYNQALNKVNNLLGE